jgi:hypothetical protein
MHIIMLLPAITGVIAVTFIVGLEVYDRIAPHGRALRSAWTSAIRPVTLSGAVPVGQPVAKV